MHVWSAQYTLFARSHACLKYVFCSALVSLKSLHMLCFVCVCVCVCVHVCMVGDSSHKNTDTCTAITAYTHVLYMISYAKMVHAIRVKTCTMSIFVRLNVYRVWRERFTICNTITDVPYPSDHLSSGKRSFVNQWTVCIPFPIVHQIVYELSWTYSEPWTRVQGSSRKCTREG